MASNTALRCWHDTQTTANLTLYHRYRIATYTGEVACYYATWSRREEYINVIANAYRVLCACQTGVQAVKCRRSYAATFHMRPQNAVQNVAQADTMPRGDRRRRASVIQGAYGKCALLRGGERWRLLLAVDRRYQMNAAAVS